MDFLTYLQMCLATVAAASCFTMIMIIAQAVQIGKMKKDLQDASRRIDLLEIDLLDERDGYDPDPPAVVTLRKAS